MKRLITLCTVMMFGACTIVLAQNAPDKTKATGTKEIKPETKVEVPASDRAAANQQAEPKKVLTTDLKANAQGNAVAPKRLGEHGPYLNDPDYDAKKAEWIKNYPQEYDPALKAKTETDKK